MRELNTKLANEHEVFESRAEKAESKLALAMPVIEAARGVLDGMGVVMDDERLGYIEAQLGRDDVANLRSILAAYDKGENQTH